MTGDAVNYIRHQWSVKAAAQGNLNSADDEIVRLVIRARHKNSMW